MGTAPAFASVGEAMDMARAALGYLAAADAAQLAAAELAECLQTLEQTDAISTAARASFLATFTTRRRSMCCTSASRPRRESWMHRGELRRATPMSRRSTTRYS